MGGIQSVFKVQVVRGSRVSGNSQSREEEDGLFLSVVRGFARTCSEDSALNEQGEERQEEKGSRETHAFLLVVI